MRSKPYEEKFRVGDRVRVRSRADLERFKNEWKYHHPLTDEQVLCADAVGTVQEIGYYHGGDVLYQLDNILGMWHEENLSEA